MPGLRSRYSFFVDIGKRIIFAVKKIPFPGLYSILKYGVDDSLHYNFSMAGVFRK